MEKTITLIIFLLILKLSMIKANSIKCGDKEIDNCKVCGQGEESESCATCEVEHFPVLDNLLCFACDDSIYGQVGCKGECDSSEYSKSGFAYCQECKEGYYNLEGICYKCEIGSPGCISCTYSEKEVIESKRFKCQKCLNNEEYRIDDNFRCEKCDELLSHCKKCHYSEGQPQCDECESDYFVNSEKTCSACYYQSISGGECHICSSDLMPDFCRCSSNYFLRDDSCVHCQDNFCSECVFNEETATTKCLRCYAGYTLNSENQCVSCEERCNYCYLDNNNNSFCFNCESKKYLPDSSKCLVCSNGCSECEYDSDKKEAICTKCYDYWTLVEKDNQCNYCRSISETGEGCGNCLYNTSSEKYECKTCDYTYNLGYYHYDYAYVKNTFQCLSNTNPERIGLYGCILSQYIQSSDKYECLECKNYTDNYFIPVTTDKSCIIPSSVGLSNICLESEKIGDSYSCSKCKSNYTLVQDISTGIKKCYEREETLSYCLEGKLEDGNFMCTKCVDNSLPHNNICSCNSDSFSKDTKWCFKCNDLYKGNSGCDETKGCDYFSANDQLNCKECKDGYFEYTEGQCFLCSNEIPNCDKCHYDNTNKKLICDSCKEIYDLNIEDNICQLKECEEYPEISPGCVICKDKLDEYKEKNKCQKCKYGYFKTKDEKCVYCRSEQYGGPGCDECGYQLDENGIETDNIICKGCYPNYLNFSSKTNDYFYYYYDYYNNHYHYGYGSYSNYLYQYDYSHYFNYYYHNNSYNTILLSSKGKCYDCQILFSDACVKCGFIKNENGIENLKCIICSAGYYLSPEGNCVNFTGLINDIPNCDSKILNLGNLEFWIYEDYYGYYYNYHSYYIYFRDGLNLSDYNAYISEIILQEKEKLDSECKYCEFGYFLNENGNCEQLSYDKCTFNSIIKNHDKFRYTCREFCIYDNYNVLIRLRLKAKLEDKISEVHLDNLTYNDYINFFNNYGELLGVKSCLNNSGEGGEYAPEKLKYCKEAYYFPENETYSCIRCKSDYSLNNITHLCYKDETTDNYPSNSIEIIDPYDYPYNYANQYTLVIYENNEKEYVYPEGDLTGCVEAKANTTFIYSKYDCTNCSLMYIPFYSKFFDRIICQNVKGKIIKENEISYDLYNFVKEKVNAINGICEKNYLFTPDGQKCYKCDEETVGMPGCKGECSFSLKRNKPLRCESECKIGYIKSSEGICSSCSSVNKGCYECHYENEYPLDYIGIKRQRRFVCDYCEEGYYKSSLGQCLDCHGLGLDYCDKCQLDTNNNSYICTKCSDNFFLNEEGYCQMCDEYHFKGINTNKCVDCGNTLEGGIDKCLFCDSDGERAVCKLCEPGYILLTNNNSCLEIVKNKELQYFSNCEKITMENKKFMCSKCKKEYSLLQKNDIKECTYIPTLYDSKFERNYENHFYKNKKQEMTYNDFYLFKQSDYIYNRYINYYPCQEAENIGNEQNPLYSCTKCYEQLNDKIYNFIFNRTPVKITEENSKQNYCVYYYSHNDLQNCAEATYKIKNGKEIYNCTECKKNNVLTINRLTNTYYCQSTNATTKCLVLYCKTCNPNDGYICNECLPDYEVNTLTGSCVKKTEVVPAITWKDIYRLEMNGEKLVNNKYIHGPSLRMRGITSSQINTRHAFLIYLTFKIKNRLRNLQEDTIKMPAICEVVEGVDETSDDVNMVDYECIGNQTNEIDLTNYKLNNIEEGNNDNSLKKSNLNELVSEIKARLGDLEKLEEIIEPSFTFEDLIKIVIFQMNEKIEKLQAKDFKFNFKIEGKLNKDITQTEIAIKKKFELAEVDTKADCTFRIGLNKVADLSCDLNVKAHKDIPTFSFKTSQINTENNEIYLSKFNDIVLINSEKDDDKTIIIIVSVVCSVVGAGLIGVGIFFLVRKLKSSKKDRVVETYNNDNSNKRNLQTNKIFQTKEGETAERVIQFGNK